LISVFVSAQKFGVTRDVPLSEIKTLSQRRCGEPEFLRASTDPTFNFNSGAL